MPRVYRKGLTPEEKVINRRAYEKQYRIDHLEHIRKRDRGRKRGKRTQKKYPGTRRRYYLNTTYGPGSAELYDRLVKESNGRCGICDKIKKLSIDHDHETGKIRGLLCTDCNTSIGKLGDTVASVERAVRYLKGEKNG